MPIYIPTISIEKVIYNFCHVFTSEVLLLVTGSIGLVTSITFGWDIMLMNARYIIGIKIVHVQLLLAVIQLLLTVLLDRVLGTYKLARFWEDITWQGYGYM